MTARPTPTGRNSDGDAFLDLSNPGAGFTGFSGYDLGVVPTDWTIEQVGDFNGDGKADILWRYGNGDDFLYLSNPGAGFTGFSGLDLGLVPTSWSIVGGAPLPTGDSYVWSGPITGSWGVAANWTDLSTGQDPAATPPGGIDAVTIDAAANGIQVITGAVAAAKPHDRRGDHIRWPGLDSGPDVGREPDTQPGRQSRR